MGIFSLQGKSPSEIALIVLALLMFCGLGVITLFAATASSVPNFLSSASVSLLAAAACAVVGSLLGFLFGIPRSLTVDGETAGSQEESKNNSGSPNTGYQANDNLVQISDWLTKILVGVGLTQIGTFPEKLNKLAAFVSPGLSATEPPNVLAMSILIYYPISGFLFSYLWTRLYLGSALRKADMAAIGAFMDQIKHNVEKVTKIGEQGSDDTRAHSLVQRFLNTPEGAPKPSEEELTKAILEASSGMKATIFYLAWDVRAKTWRNTETKPRMERTIPIFRALIESDTNNEFHMNHGQLGFALKDKEVPDWKAAHDELSIAIDMRKDWRKGGWLFYEFNRALCKINLLRDISEPVSADQRIAILDDLNVAGQSDALVAIMQDNPQVIQWIAANNVTWDDIKRPNR